MTFRIVHCIRVGLAFGVTNGEKKIKYELLRRPTIFPSRVFPRYYRYSCVRRIMNVTNAKYMTDKWVEETPKYFRPVYVKNVRASKRVRLSHPPRGISKNADELETRTVNIVRCATSLEYTRPTVVSPVIASQKLLLCTYNVRVCMDVRVHAYGDQSVGMVF